MSANVIHVAQLIEHKHTVLFVFKCVQQVGIIFNECVWTLPSVCSPRQKLHALACFGVTHIPFVSPVADRVMDYQSAHNKIAIRCDGWTARCFYDSSCPVGLPATRHAQAKDLLCPLITR